ncbi:MAG: GNAT family N-acetyltransferase [Lachnospiraceae bacterium]|nr:GNAT family N-acetyltransferase [Lachnospiraceae bacterium]
MNYNIQKGKEEDWEDAMVLAYRTFQKYVAKGYTEEGVNNFVDFISDQHLFRMFMVGEYHLWVAKDEEGNIIGMGSLRSGNHISLLFVDEDFLRNGIGTAIVKEMEEFVKEINKDFITVNASPFGIPFYHSIGFEDTGKQTVNGGMTITPMRKMV